MVQINSVGRDAPWGWLARGAQDFRRAFWPCFILGLGFTLASGLIAYGLFQAGLGSWLFALAGGFLILAPLLATGLYECARRLEQGETVTIRSMLLARARSPMQLAYLGMALAILYVLWVRLAQVLYAMFSFRTYQGMQDFGDFLLNTPNGMTMAIIGTLVGGVIAAAAFAISAISAPMLLDRRTDVFSAMAASVAAVRRNPAAMMLWAIIIAALTALGIATLFIGLAFVFPWVGLASWHAYRSVTESAVSEVAT